MHGHDKEDERPRDFQREFRFAPIGDDGQKKGQCAGRPEYLEGNAELLPRADVPGRKAREQEGDRPDRLGAIFSVCESDVIGPYFQVAEFRPGAIEDPRVQTIVETLGKSWPVLWMKKKSRVLIAAPKERLTEIAAKVAELTDKHQKRRHLSLVKGGDC